jgi:hypothetical protein
MASTIERNRPKSACRTIEGIETVNMIRNGRVGWVAKKDVVAEARFIAKLFGSCCLTPTSIHPSHSSSSSVLLKVRNGIEF